MKFRLAAQRHDGEWVNLEPFGLFKLRELKQKFIEARATGLYAFIAIYASNGARRIWEGELVRGDKLGTPSYSPEGR